MTPIFDLCDAYIVRSAALDPVLASMRGLGGDLGPATDYSPDGHAARAALLRETLAELARLPVTSPADRLAADHLRERLEADLAWHDSGEHLRFLRAPFGLVNMIKNSVELLPRGDDEHWRAVAARLAAVPSMLAGWRASLDDGLARGLPAARRQAIEAAVQAGHLAGGTHDGLVAAYGDGPLAGELRDAARAAHAGYASTATYLRDTYAPEAAAADGVGAERHALAARHHLGADLDPVEAYAWGWEELARAEAEMVAEADRISPGASVAEAAEALDASEVIEGVEAYKAWLQDRHDEAIERLDGTHFDIPEPLRTVEVNLVTDPTAGAAFYTRPADDLTRPGRTWWPVRGRERFTVWRELTTVFHEGVPGHHLELGGVTLAGERLSRFARHSFVPGHGEGWALYAERLADELGWFAGPGTRLGMLGGSALRAARVVVDIGVHLDLPLPDGSRWTFEKACELLQTRGHCEPFRVEAEMVRYCGWPAQAITYKLGERAWLAAREEARRRPGFDLRRWHGEALALGPIGLDGLTEALRALGGERDGEGPASSGETAG